MAANGIRLADRSQRLAAARRGGAAQVNPDCLEADATYHVVSNPAEVSPPTTTVAARGCDGVHATILSASVTGAGKFGQWTDRIGKWSASA